MSDAAPSTAEQQKSTGQGPRLPSQVVNNTRILVVVHIASGLVVWYIFSEALKLLWAQMGWPNPRYFGLAEARQPILVAVAAGVIAVGIVATNKKVQVFANEVINELRKVTWPSMKETRQTTFVVLIVTGVISTILGAWDFVFSKIIKELLSLPLGG